MLKCGFCGKELPAAPKKAKTGKVNKNEKKRIFCSPRCGKYLRHLRWLTNMKHKLMEENK